MSAAVTLQDVVMLAGVSAKTVSRVINDDSAATERTAERVRNAITALDYTPNPHAWSLRTGRDQMVALVIDSISGIIPAPCLLSFENCRSPRGPRRRPRRGGRPTPGRRHGPGGQRREQPLGGGPPHRPRAPAHRLHLATIDPTAARELLVSYRAVLADAGIEFDRSLVAVYRARARVLEPLLGGPGPVTVIFSSDAMRTMDIVWLLHGTGCIDLAFVGFDDFVTADSRTPPLSVVHQDPLLMGRNVADLLLRRIQGDQSPLGASTPRPLSSRAVRWRFL